MGGDCQKCYSIIGKPVLSNIWDHYRVDKLHLQHSILNLKKNLPLNMIISPLKDEVKDVENGNDLQVI
ncbi:4843_t:CDS:2 [Funneliformis caledonium]|uniref:4843_t:CDS:1 n=1 Tax=Funneliformis caledonium TaxID=1117310 RepID=A0A9N9BCV8_9GLOM|nr:4843_t:CDS:2 [Funneliformis caledonium]